MTKPSSPKKPTAAVAAVDCSAAADRYKGVRRRKWGKYVSEIRLPNSRERIWLGSYDSAEKAARAFDAALFCLRGSSARFNFPNNPPPAIAGAGLLSRAEIQTVAAQFANSDPPPSSECTRPAANSPMNSSSPSPSVVSEVGTAVVECDERSPFLDLHTDNYGSGFGYFEPEYNPFFDEFSSSSATPYFDYGEENFDAMTTHQDSFLWNF